MMSTVRRDIQSSHDRAMNQVASEIKSQEDQLTSMLEEIKYLEKVASASELLQSDKEHQIRRLQQKLEARQEEELATSKQLAE